MQKGFQIEQKRRNIFFSNFVDYCLFSNFKPAKMINSRFVFTFEQRCEAKLENDLVFFNEILVIVSFNFEKLLSYNFMQTSACHTIPYKKKNIIQFKTRNAIRGINCFLNQAKTEKNVCS